MPDIFISYKKEEREVASRLATRLTEAGYDVWWDAALLAGERFEDEISSVLTACKAVIILWSRKSADSDWVKAEAETARQQKKALPTVIDDLPIDNLPLLFRGLHVASLADWDGNGEHPGFKGLMKSVGDRVGAAQGPALSIPQAEAKLAQSVGEAEIWSAIAGSREPSAEEYRAYLMRYGANGRFAELARIRIARLEKEEAAQAEAARANVRALVASGRPVVADDDEGDDDVPVVARRRRKRGRAFGPGTLVGLAALVLILAVGVFVFRDPTIMSRLTGMMVPQEVKDAAARCSTWSTSAKLDWSTSVPKLGPTTLADCDKAKTGLSSEPDYTGMLALARIEQGSSHADEAISLANAGVASKSPSANYAMGAMYEHGVNLPRDVKRAAVYYRAAADLGLARAAAKLCLLSLDEGSPPDGMTAEDLRHYCDTANDAGDVLGRVAQGYILEAGFDGHTVDYAGAAELYRQAADQGSPDAQLALGALFQRGVGVDRDWSRALSLFSAAADAGYPEALRRLAIMYELGQGAPADVNHAAQLYETASIKGDLPALFLADYGVGDSVSITNRLTNEMERLAGEPNNPVGERMLGQLYERGYMRNTDFTQAQQQYELCANQNNAMCQYMLGYFYYYRQGENTKALELFQASADQGNLYGQYWVAYMTEYGYGTTADLNKALSYYRLAANQGHLSAINRLATENHNTNKS
ncbi:MAG: toll/interleukin-1 receptor domain-containing protein [Devosia sp.]